MDEHDLLNTAFDLAWARACLFFPVTPEVREAARHVYITGRMDGMAYLTDKNIEVQMIRQAHKTTIRGMEGN